MYIRIFDLIKNSGFSYIEVLVTLCLMGLLAASIFPVTKLVAQYEKEKQLKLSLLEIRTAIDRYKAASDSNLIPEMYRTDSGYPPNLYILLGVRSERDNQVHRFLRKIPEDPFYKSSGQEHAWTLRSYSTEKDSPAYKGDVYDVYSKSNIVGSNGLKYSQW